MLKGSVYLSKHSALNSISNICTKIEGKKSDLNILPSEVHKIWGQNISINIKDLTTLLM